MDLEDQELTFVSVYWGPELRVIVKLAVSMGTAVLLVPAAGPASASLPDSVASGASSTTARVTRIVDGDTIDTTAGRVRVVGVNTPEVGQCNADRATARTRKLVPVGSTVRLRLPAGENNVDAYGRILRYVTRKGVDLGGALIKAGLADARYDSLDGYPHHPKQSKYRRWDKRYPDKTCSSGTNNSKASGAYTGCRAYGPNGTSVDDQGRRYTKIDCTTKKPL